MAAGADIDAIFGRQALRIDDAMHGVAFVHRQKMTRPGTVAAFTTDAAVPAASLGAWLTMATEAALFERRTQDDA